MAVVGTPVKNGVTAPPKRVEATFTERIDAVQEASEDSFPASDPPSLDAGHRRWHALQCNDVLRQCGRYTLVRGTHGFWWALTSREGFVWYWHSQIQLWIANRCSHSTIEEATAGLDEMLAKEVEKDSEKQSEQEIPVSTYREVGCSVASHNDIKVLPT